MSDYDLPAIRKLLEKMFNSEELNNFCFDHFRKFYYEQFNLDASKAARVRSIIEYVDRTGKHDELLRFMVEAVPTRADDINRLRPGQPSLPQMQIPVNTSPPRRTTSGPRVNLDDELAVFEKIVIGQDTQTRLLTVHGESGVGKSRLLEECRELADANKVGHLSILLGSQLSIEDCLHQIVSFIGLTHFDHYHECLDAGRPQPFTRTAEQEWRTKLTNAFARDCSSLSSQNLLVIFFDQYEKADYVFKDWLNRVLLPTVLNLPLLIFVAGQEEINPKPSWPNQQHFFLTGLSVEHFVQYAEACQVSLDRFLIEECHKLLQGRPNDFVTYIASKQGGGGVG